MPWSAPVPSDHIGSYDIILVSQSPAWKTSKLALWSQNHPKSTATFPATAVPAVPERLIRSVLHQSWPMENCQVMKQHITWVRRHLPSAHTFGLLGYLREGLVLAIYHGAIAVHGHQWNPGGHGAVEEGLAILLGCALQSASPVVVVPMALHVLIRRSRPLWQPASCAHSNEGVASLARPQPRSRQVHLSHRGAWRTLAACQRGMLHQLRRSWWPATGPGSRAGNDRCVLSSSCSNLWRLRAVFPPSLGHWFRHSHSGLPSEQPRGLHVPRQLQWHLWGQGLWPQQSRSADTPFIIGMGPWAIYGHILLKLPRVHTSTWPSQHIQGYEHMHYANSWNIKTTKGKHIRFHPINQFLVSSMHIASVETCFNPWQCLSQIRTLGTFHGTRLSRITHHMVRWKNAGKGFFVQAGVFATAWRRHDEKWWVDANG